MPISPLEIARAVIDVNEEPDAGALPMVDPAPTIRVSLSGRSATIQATSILSSPFYHFWLDGNYLGRNQTGIQTVRIEAGNRAAVTVRVTRSSSYDVDQAIPESFSGIVSVEWVRSTGGDVREYLLETRIVGDAQGFVPVARVPARGQWRYTAKTPVLTDDQDWNLRVVPVDNFGNRGTRILYGARRVIRAPDAVQITASLAGGNVTIAEAN